MIRSTREEPPMLINLHGHHMTRGMFNQDEHWGPFYEDGALRIGKWVLGKKVKPPSEDDVGRDPRHVLDDLGRFIVTTDPERFATVAYARLEPSSGRTRWSSAGHPPPLLVDAAGGHRFLTEVRGPPLGTTVGNGYNGAALDLEPGDTLLLYTDGVVERRTSALYEGLERLAALAVDHREVSASELVDLVIERLGAAAEDDCCVLVARRLTPV